MRKVKIIEINGKQVEVDEQCAEMVEFFNNIGLKTRMCCQGHEKPIYRIWFDVEDSKIEEFIKKTSQWTEVGIRPINPEKTKWETYRYVRGLRGWFYKRIWYPKGEYRREDWVYQVEGANNHDTYRNVQRDFITMKAIYYGKDLEAIQKTQQEVAQILAKKQENENSKHINDDLLD